MAAQPVPLEPARLPSTTPSMDEPWAPKLEVVNWQVASEIPGCPWDFDDCEGLPEALEWRKPLCADLQSGFDALRPRVKKVRVAKICFAMPKAVHFSVVHTHPEHRRRALRWRAGGARRRRRVRRTRGPAPAKGRPFGESDCGPRGLRHAASLPAALLPQFGVPLAVKHLPLLMASPRDTARVSKATPPEVSSLSSSGATS